VTEPTYEELKAKIAELESKQERGNTMRDKVSDKRRRRSSRSNNDKLLMGFLFGSMSGRGSGKHFLLALLLVAFIVCFIVQSWLFWVLVIGACALYKFILWLDARFVG
jgi:Flp pilus assembly protein TadB